MLKSKKRFLLVALFSTFGTWGFGSDISIPNNLRAENTGSASLNWWAAAATLCNVYGIANASNIASLTDEVSHETIAKRMIALGIKLESNPEGKSANGAKWVTDKITSGAPVIVCQNVLTGDKVAVVACIMIGYDGANVTLIYPSKPGVELVVSYAEWYEWWYGRAYCFSGVPPAKPAAKAVVVAPPPKQSLRLLPFEQPLLPLPSLQFPSNQDIKDGVRRPDDRLHYGLYGEHRSSGYDYHSEFNKKR